MSRRAFVLALLSLLSLLFLGACARPGPPTSAKMPPPGTVADILRLSQRFSDHSARLPGPLFSPELQAAHMERYRRRFFAPWDQEASSYTADQALWALSAWGGKEVWGENLLPRDPDWLRRMARASDHENFPSLALHGVAVRPTSLRLLPTDRPLFLDPAQAGEGYPFDYLQNSAVHTGAPLFLSHRSADGAWLYAETGYAGGWLPAQDVALADAWFMEAYRQADLAVAVADGVSLRGPVWDSLEGAKPGRFMALAHTGAVLPRRDGTLLVPLRDADGIAILAEAPMPEGLEPLPLDPTPANLGRVGDALAGVAYGWGGLYQNRDCSSLVRDLFGPFGLWLPRNSRAQKDAGRVVSLEGLSEQAKERRILEEGVPCQTLLFLPGHIMVYLGTDKGEPLAFHAIWGLRTENDPPGDPTPGRWVLGRAVVTGLSPGAELPFLTRPRGILLHRLTAMTILGEKENQ